MIIARLLPWITAGFASGFLFLSVFPCEPWSLCSRVGIFLDIIVLPVVSFLLINRGYLKHLFLFVGCFLVGMIVRFFLMH